MVRPILAICLLTWSVSPVSAQRAGGTVDAAASTRLQTLLDKEEIAALLLDYGRHLDNRDFGAYSRLFARDGEWVGGFGSVTGPANIQAFMEKKVPVRTGYYWSARGA